MKADLLRCTLSHCRSQKQFGIQTFPCANNLIKSLKKQLLAGNYHVIHTFYSLGLRFQKHCHYKIYIVVLKLNWAIDCLLYLLSWTKRNELQVPGEFIPF